MVAWIVCYWYAEKSFIFYPNLLFPLPSHCAPSILRFTAPILMSHLFLTYLLNHETFHLVLEGADLAHEIRSFVRGDAAADHSSRDTTGAAQSHFRGHVDVWCVFIFAEKRKMEENRERRSIRRKDDDLADTTVEGLGRFVRALLELAVVAGLLDCGIVRVVWFMVGC